MFCFIFTSSEIWNLFCNSIVLIVLCHTLSICKDSLFVVYNPPIPPVFWMTHWCNLLETILVGHWVKFKILVSYWSRNQAVGLTNQSERPTHPIVRRMMLRAVSLAGLRGLPAGGPLRRFNSLHSSVERVPEHSSALSGVF